MVYIDVPDWDFGNPISISCIPSSSKKKQQRGADGASKNVPNVMKLENIKISKKMHKDSSNGLKDKSCIATAKTFNEPNSLIGVRNASKSPRPEITEFHSSLSHSSSVGSQLQNKMQDRLKGSKFRWINEKLYTISGAAAFELMNQDPTLFAMYHEGFRQQVLEWPLNPVDVYLKELIYLGKRGEKQTIADFGCGEAILAKKVIGYPNLKMHSFDLIAANELVTPCDMSHVPLQENSVDKVIFCLSLMGTDYMQFLIEAHRILASNGTLNIAEVESRLPNIDAFVELVHGLGFDHRRTKKVKVFVFFEFGKRKNHSKISPDILATSTDVLKPCLYKKR